MIPLFTGRTPGTQFARYYFVFGIVFCLFASFLSLATRSHAHEGDATPGAFLYYPRAGVGPNLGKVVLSWEVWGKKLCDTPIALYYREKEDGAWGLIAGRLENTGKYAWRVPGHVPSKVFLRLQVNDKDGNKLVVADTGAPISIDSSISKER